MKVADKSKSKSDTEVEDIINTDETSHAVEDEKDIITDSTLTDDSYDGPGALRGTSILKLETRKGQLVFNGRAGDRDKGIQPIIGLKSFASYLRSIWDASSNNDPYGDWWLLKVELNLAEKEAWIDGKQKEYMDILSQFKNMSHEVAHSISPIERELRFSIPYSFKGAMLLMKHDELVKIIMTAHHVGLVDSDTAHHNINRSTKLMRSAFQSVTGYRFTGVTRDDIHSNNPVAQKATELMGPIPFGIQDDEVVPAFQSQNARLRRLYRQNKVKAMKQKKVS